MTPKGNSVKGKIDNFDVIELKTPVLQRNCGGKNGKKSCKLGKKMCKPHIQQEYLDYIRNSQESVVKRNRQKKKKIRKWAKVMERLPPTRIYRWKISPGKDIQHD